MGELIIPIILGLVEGITEFLPVSSTGHLILAGHVLGFSSEKAETFEIFIQSGAILAVVVLYFKRFMALIPVGGKPTGALQGINGLIKIACACAPAFILGAVFHHAIKAYLFTPFTVALGFIVGAILILFAEGRKSAVTSETMEALTLSQVLKIGLFQCLALWPGMSRSGSTIVGGILSGCSRTVAAEFSFLIAVPVMLAAVGLDMLKSASLLSTADILPFAVGFIVAFCSAMIAIRTFLGFLQRYSLRVFAYYRIVVGIIILLVLR